MGNVKGLHTMQSACSPSAPKPEHSFQSLKAIGVRETQQNHGTQGKALTEILT